MQIREVNVSEIKEYAKNAKKHPSDQVQAIANSIKEFGFRQPLVLDKNMEIIVGHGRLAAAKLLGMTAVPVVMASDLTEEQVKAFRLADNKTNESDWDFDLLAEEIGNLPGLDMTDFGFNEREILELTIDDSPEEIPVRREEYHEAPKEFAGEYGIPSPAGEQSPSAAEYEYAAGAGVTRQELEEYESRASQMVTRRVIIIFKTDEEEEFVRRLLKVPDEEKLGVIYLAEKMMSAE